MQQPSTEAPGPARDFIGYGANRPTVNWPNGANIAVSVVINIEEGSEVSYAREQRNEAMGEIAYKMGPGYRDLCVESVFEYGSRAGIWRLLRLMDEYRIPTTFYAAAVALEENPELAKWIRTSDHEVCSHGLRWEEVWRLSREEEREHIRAAIASFEKTIGKRPVGWYCRYGPSIHTRELLAEEGGFIYDSDSYADDLPYYVDSANTRHLVVPYSLVYNDFRYVASTMGSPADFLDVCRRGFDELLVEGRNGEPKMMSIGLHSRFAGQAGRANALREFLEHANSQGDVWFATREQIARYWLEYHPETNAAAGTSELEAVGFVPELNRTRRTK